MNDAGIKQILLMKLQYRSQERLCKASLPLPATEHSVNIGVVNLRVTLGSFLNRKGFPLTAHVEQFQNVVEVLESQQFWSCSSASIAQMGKDKFLELLLGQMSRNLLKVRGL